MYLLLLGCDVLIFFKFKSWIWIWTRFFKCFNALNLMWVKIGSMNFFIQ